jgi:hypothetical protein
MGTEGERMTNLGFSAISYIQVPRDHSRGLVILVKLSGDLCKDEESRESQYGHRLVICMPRDHSKHPIPSYQ